MLHLTSGPALVVEAGLAVFCFLDVVLSPEAAVRWIPRWAWALALLTFPICGCVLWITAGRSWRSRQRATVPGRPGEHAQPAAPSEPGDDEHRRILQLWEADLRRREAALRRAPTRRRRRGGAPGGAAPPAAGPSPRAAP